MAPDPVSSDTKDKRLASRFPTAYTILFLLIILMAGLTWVIPAGKFDRVQNAAVGREVAVAGTYKTVDSNPQGFAAILLAPTAGFYDPDSYAANAIDVSLFVLFLGGFLGVVNATGSIDTGIKAAMRKLKGREVWMIPILMSLFALGGTTYGMAEETLAFYPLLIPAMLVAGFDTMTAVAVILLGAGIGTLGSTINPFATVIASNAAGVAFTEGMVLRFVLLLGGLAICIAFVTRYALRVKADPARSVVAAQAESNRQVFLSGTSASANDRVTGIQSLVLVLFAATFVVLIWGVSSQGWWMAQMGALFLGMAILIGVVTRMGEKRLTSTFVDGARDLLGVALIIGLARGIVVIMQQGLIADTILNSAALAVSGLPKLAFINLMYWIEVAMSFLVPSSSGLAVLSMPIMAPLADFAGVTRDLVVTAYQSASGIVNLITPTSAVVIGALAIGRISYDRWIVFIWPLLLILTIFISVVFSIAAIL
ncbi:MAG: C4-dicarboxylate ABC transporter [Rhizobiales bacterium 17-65-6]|nr:MAG: C4-dicarboxylate ABC transporter [Rhizobiales bacterium 17-65-6]